MMVTFSVFNLSEREGRWVDSIQASTREWREILMTGYVDEASDLKSVGLGFESHHGTVGDN